MEEEEEEEAKRTRAEPSLRRGLGLLETPREREEREGTCEVVYTRQGGKRREEEEAGSTVTRLCPFLLRLATLAGKREGRADPA